MEPDVVIKPVPLPNLSRSTEQWQWHIWEGNRWIDKLRKVMLTTVPWAIHTMAALISGKYCQKANLSFINKQLIAGYYHNFLVESLRNCTNFVNRNLLIQRFKSSFISALSTTICQSYVNRMRIICCIMPDHAANCKMMTLTCTCKLAIRCI